MTINQEALDRLEDGEDIVVNLNELEQAAVDAGGREIGGIPVTESKGVVEKVNSRIIGYHFAGLHLYPGRNSVREVFVGDPGIQGMVSVKVVYSGTGHRNSIYTVPIQIIVIEEEELPIAIVSSMDKTIREQ